MGPTYPLCFSICIGSRYWLDGCRNPKALLLCQPSVGVCSRCGVEDLAFSFVAPQDGTLVPRCTVGAFAGVVDEKGA